MQNRKKKDTDLQNSLLDSVGEGEGGMVQEDSIETCILSRVKQITSPGWMHETSARAWCTGKTQRERVEREVGGGIGMGNTCKPMAVSFQFMTKFTTKKKKKALPNNSQKNYYRNGRQITTTIKNNSQTLEVDYQLSHQGSP